jgi:hypothetical protein
MTQMIWAHLDSLLLLKDAVGLYFMANLEDTQEL